MPSMASITVKKADGSTDITYDAVVSSSGDQPAVWRQDTGAPAGLPVGLRPTFEMSSKWNGPRTARVMNIKFVYPYATEDTTTSVYSSKDRVVINGGNVTSPAGIPSSVSDEAMAQYTNLVDSALIVSALKSGYAPT
jgi:hypothetical protein